MEKSKTELIKDLDKAYSRLEELEQEVAAQQEAIWMLEGDIESLGDNEW